MNSISSWRRLAGGAALGLAALAFAGQALPQSKPMASKNDLVLTGDAKCTTCHDESDKPGVMRIGKTKHGTRADGRTPTCTTCHGKGEQHILEAEKGSKTPVQTEVAFGRKSKTSMDERSAVCLTCHQGGKRIHWERSAHAGGEVACSSCHQVHTAHDRARDKIAQNEVCFTCHKEQRAQMRRPSRHPIEEGKVACSDCHNPHGTAGPKQLIRDNVNDTCYQCHMEKRGPFVRTHEPVQEDCSICHNPHGTTTPNLLKVRAPFLCQSCHQGSSHHSTVPSSTPAGGATPALGQAVIMARGCLNCHTQIHGTNNPNDSGRGFRD